MNLLIHDGNGRQYNFSYFDRVIEKAKAKI